MAEIIDINAVKLARMAQQLVQQDINSITYTTIKVGKCRTCSGAGLLRMCNGRQEPFWHDWRDLHKVDRASILVCKTCGGTGDEYREVIVQGEAECDA